MPGGITVEVQRNIPKYLQYFAGFPSNFYWPKWSNSRIKERNAGGNSARIRVAFLGYAIRTEFQMRRSPHAHFLLWTSDFPEFSEDNMQEDIELVDQNVSGELSDANKIQNCMV